MLPAAAHALGVEHDEVGDRARFDPAPAPQPVEARGDVGELSHRFFEREEAALAHRLAEQHRRVVRVAHEIGVRAGVGSAEHRAVVVPDTALARATPHRSRPREGTSDGKTIVSGSRSGSTTSIRTSTGSAFRVDGDVGDRASDEVARTVGRVGDLEQLGLARLHRVRGATASSTPARSRGTGLGIADGATSRSGGQRDDLAPSRAVVEHAARPHPHEVGQRERDDVGAVLGGVVARRELLLVDSRRGQAAEQVPVERSVRGQRHLGHQLDAIGADRRRLQG